MDILIKNGTVVDGTGKPGFLGDVGIAKGNIVGIGDMRGAQATKIIDAANFVVAPGFVDILNHADAYLTIFSVPNAESLLRQGITTVLGGNCGSSLAPMLRGDLIASVQKWGDIRDINVNWERFGELLAEVERRGVGVNFASLVGHATLRRGFLGDETRALSIDELRGMQKLFEDALAEGAFGLSFAPPYTHAREAPRDEILALLRPLSKTRRLFSMHLRDEGWKIEAAVSEALAFARDAKVNLEISHFKVVGQKFWTTQLKTVNRIEEAVRQGIAVNFDVYPYTTMALVAYLLLPDWAARGGRKETLARLQNPELRKRAVEEMRAMGIDYAHIVVATARRDRTYVGKTLGAIAKGQGVGHEEALMNLLIANEGRLILFLNELDACNVEQALSHPRSFVSSAGGGYDMQWAHRGELVHPRSFGAFPHALERLLRGKSPIKLEEAIWKMTGGPAEKIGLKDRGVLRKGAIADIVVFDPVSVGGRATYENPYRYPQGIEHVLVNGVLAVENQAYTGARSGKVLRAA